MNWTKEKIEIGRDLLLAVERGQIDLVRDLCEANRWLVTDHTWHGSKSTWIKTPARRGNIQMIKTMLQIGFDVNALSGKEQSTALTSAVDCDHFELAEFLLENGADSSLSRPLIAALNSRKDPKLQLSFVKLLIEDGVDVNRLYNIYGDPTNQMTALDFARVPSVIEFLRSVGAKHSTEILNDQDGLSNEIAT